MTRILAIMMLMAFSTTLGGCLLGVAAGAGYVAADEAKEGDGNFDPLEEVRGKGDGKN